MKNFISLLLLFSSVAINAQTITGYVCAKKDKTPIEFATVTLLNLPDSSVINGVTTQKNGAYSFSSVMPGKYFIKCAFLGFHTTGKQIRTSVNKPALFADTIFLEDATQQIKEVTVTGAHRG